MAWKHEQFALSVLPQNSQTGDILRKSLLEALEQEGLSRFQVLAKFLKLKEKTEQESAVIQTARAIARVAS